MLTHRRRIHLMQQIIVVAKGFQICKRCSGGFLTGHGAVEHFVLANQHPGSQRAGCIRARLYHFKAAILRKLANHVRIDGKLVLFPLIGRIVAVLPHLHQLFAVAQKGHGAQAANFPHALLKGTLLPFIGHNTQAAFIRKVLRASLKNHTLPSAKRDNAKDNALPVILLHIGQRYRSIDLLHTKTFPLP